MSVNFPYQCEDESIFLDSDSEIVPMELDEDNEMPEEVAVFGVEKSGEENAKNLSVLPEANTVKLIDQEDFNMLGTETKELISRCMDYIKLFIVRYIKKDIPLRLLKQLYELAQIYNVPLFIKLKDNRRGGYEMAKLCNLYMFFSLELEASKYFTIRVISVLRILFAQVMKRDWNSVGLTFSNIPLILSETHHGKLGVVWLSQMFSIYFPSLYLVVLQRFLESEASIKDTSENYINAMNQFIRSGKFPKNKDNHYVFYLLHVLIFQVAHFRLDSCELLLDYNFLNTDPNWTRVYSTYRYCYEYEKWLCSGEERPTAYLINFHLTLLSNLFGQNSCPVDSVGLLAMFVHLSKISKQLDELTLNLEAVCLKDPIILMYCHKILTRFKLERIFGILLNQAMSHHPPSILASFDFILDAMEQRSLEPENYGSLEDVVTQNLSILFHYLDYGRHREEEKAWGLLQANIQYLQNNDAEGAKLILAPFWRDREEWWPKFHSIRLPKISRRIRREIFKFLAQLSMDQSRLCK